MKLAGNDHSVDERTGAGCNVERENGSIGIVQLGRNRPYLRREVPVILVELFEHTGHLCGSTDRRRGTEAFSHRAAQLALGQAERASEVHAFDMMQWDQGVPQVHTTPVLGCIDLDILKASETVEMRDGITHLRE